MSNFRCAKYAVTLVAVLALWHGSLLSTQAAMAGGAAQTTVAKAASAGTEGSDPFLWLEDKDGARALSWVRAQNARTLPVLQGDPHYKALYAQALHINESASRIPYPEYINGSLYNFWQDAKHVRGILRRTSFAGYLTASPSWTTVLDMDALARREHANWVYKGLDCVQPDEERCLVLLSDGGEDAQTVREFDLSTGHFVPGGFNLPRAKQNAAWIDANRLIVARAWRPGQLTASGYPYVVKTLRRGQPLSAAVEVFRGKPSDVSDDPFVLRDGQGNRAVMINRGVTFFTTEEYLLTARGLRKLNVPAKLNVSGLLDGRLLFSLNQSWNTGGRIFPEGSLVSVPLAQAMTNPSNLHPSLVYAPGPRETIDNVSQTKSDLIVTIYKNVRGRALVFTPSGTGGWSMRPLNLPDNSSIDVIDTNLHNDRSFLRVSNFLMPSTLYVANAASGQPEKIKSLPPQFNAAPEVVEQHEATSKDGTKVPYFVVRPRNMRFEGNNPTILNAYGGFQISMTPYYSGVTGKLWLERGGVYVLANIRGGGEFGPAWHDAGLKTHRQRIYDDFYAVGKDLIARKITSPRRLGIVGGSNGGLLMGVEFTQHPEMWNAVQIEVPLLDMMRYEKIQAGASWVAEYGSVSVPAERQFLASISPYQNLRAGVAYPEPFIWTTTKDDRVGPQHARKFAAKLASMGVPYLFYEVIEGGHGAGANLREDAKTEALGYTYFVMKLME
ncbi:MAG TPA: prolyl oligopeptidase family serine peptidase [Candidatus Baltobacteraceae bacterium]|nr:prolyl oligopeptidase family serine peptidase [Candidatus Baltobacteraceae bacterium]